MSVLQKFFTKQLSFPESRAEEIWMKDDIIFSLIHNDHMHEMVGTWYCGYCRFPEPILTEESYDGIVAYVPVHGGITLAEQDEDGMIYGFDCMHVEDKNNILTWDYGWLINQCENMAAGLLIAAKYEQEYLKDANIDRRCNVISTMVNEMELAGIPNDFSSNFGFHLRLLGGKL